MATELMRGVNHFHSSKDTPIKLEISLKSPLRFSELDCNPENVKQTLIFLIYPTPAFKLLQKSSMPKLYLTSDVHLKLDWLQSLKQFFINVSYHILVASLTLMAMF